MSSAGGAGPAAPGGVEPLDAFLSPALARFVCVLCTKLSWKAVLTPCGTVCAAVLLCCCAAVSKSDRVCDAVGAACDRSRVLSRLCVGVAQKAELMPGVPTRNEGEAARGRRTRARAFELVHSPVLKLPHLSRALCSLWRRVVVWRRTFWATPKCCVPCTAARGVSGAANTARRTRTSRSGACLCAQNARSDATRRSSEGVSHHLP